MCKAGRNISLKIQIELLKNLLKFTENNESFQDLLSQMFKGNRSIRGLLQIFNDDKHNETRVRK